MRFKPQRQLVVAFLSVAAWSVALAGYALSDSVPLITATAFVGAMAMNFGGAFWFTALQEHVPPHALSRVSSYDWLGSWLFLPVGYVLVGPVAETIGYDETLLIAVGWTIFSSLAILLIPSVRNLRSAAGAPLGAEIPADGPDLVPRHPSGEREGVPTG